MILSYDHLRSNVLGDATLWLPCQVGVEGIAFNGEVQYELAMFWNYVLGAILVASAIASLLLQLRYKITSTKWMITVTWMQVVMFALSALLLGIILLAGLVHV